MSDKLKIKRSCFISNGEVFVDGSIYFSDDSAGGVKVFLKKLYRYIRPGHSKFFKMDSISKLGFLAAELILKETDLSEYLPEHRSITLSNSDSTLDTDSDHQKMIQDSNNFYPSPSVFVYTLPNIMIGEISIRHEMRGENAFFICEKFNAELIADHINSLFLKHKSRFFIGGWINLRNEDYEAFIYAASNDGVQLHNEKEIEKLYNTYLANGRID